jgi:hypothetical protein
MNKKQKALLESWARSFLAAAGTVAIVQIQNGSQIDFNAVLTAGVVAVLPVIQRYLNPNDPAFGKGSK